jgi:HupE / UreJ protein
MSIVFVAAEILHGRQGRKGITASAPWIVALLFGLMHGLGFASGLKDAGLPDGHIPTALLFFSIGVEAGHFLFIGFVLLVTALTLQAAQRLAPIYRERAAALQLLPAYAIGSVAMFWVIQRINAF